MSKARYQDRSIHPLVVKDCLHLTKDQQRDPLRIPDATSNCIDWLGKGEGVSGVFFLVRNSALCGKLALRQGQSHVTGLRCTGSKRRTPDEGGHTQEEFGTDLPVDRMQQEGDSPKRGIPHGMDIVPIYWQHFNLIFSLADCT